MNPSQKVSFEDTAVAFASRSDAELRKMYWLFNAMNSNFLVKTGGPLLETAFNFHLPVKFLVKPTIFQQFCGGETISECTEAINKLAESHIGTILDYSVEG